MRDGDIHSPPSVQEIIYKSHNMAASISYFSTKGIQLKKGKKTEQILGIFSIFRGFLSSVQDTNFYVGSKKVAIFSDIRASSLQT